MSKAGETPGLVRGKGGKSSLLEALGNFLRRIAWWRASNARLDFVEGNITSDNRCFWVKLHRFDGQTLEVHFDVYQLDELSDLFAKAAIGLAHKIDPAAIEAEKKALTEGETGT